MPHTPLVGCLLNRHYISIIIIITPKEKIYIFFTITSFPPSLLGGAWSQNSVSCSLPAVHAFLLGSSSYYYWLHGSKVGKHTCMQLAYFYRILLCLLLALSATEEGDRRRNTHVPSFLEFDPHPPPPELASTAAAMES